MTLIHYKKTLAAVRITRDLTNHSIVLYYDWMRLASNQNLRFIKSNGYRGSRVHFGISGSKRTDWQGKAAATQPNDAHFPLPHTDLRPASVVFTSIRQETNCERLEIRDFGR